MKIVLLANVTRVTRLSSSAPGCRDKGLTTGRIASYWLSPLPHAEMTATNNERGRFSFSRDSPYDATDPLASKLCNPTHVTQGTSHFLRSSGEPAKALVSIS